MFLPLVDSLPDCSSYAITAGAFVNQLCQLPSRLLHDVGSVASLKQLYIETNPLVSAFATSVLLGLLFLLVSEMNGNCSQVDRMWSILPNLYILHLVLWARLAGLPSSRVCLVAASTTIWSIRLTYNYWRKGGYKRGSEDYRWAVVRRCIPSFAFFILNVTFISFFQSVLLFAFSFPPAYAILLSSLFEPHISTADLVFFSIQVALVLSQWVSDGQQWAYQSAKQEYNRDAKLPRGWRQDDLDRGFITSGPWAYSRHPNFLAEQAIWFVLYQWSCYATKTLFSWTFAGSASLILLFQCSTLLTEAITSGKYPEYSEYQKQVGMFIPKSFYPYKSPSYKFKTSGASGSEKRRRQPSRGLTKKDI